MICDRCYRPLAQGEHGHMVCPLEPRRASTVWADDIPGGIEIVNGLCNEDGTPKRYYSRSEIRAACAVKGVTPYHDVYVEDGNQRIKDARVHDDWLKSSESLRVQRDKDEARREKAFQREREAARMR
jgi:hypothetical protein